LDARPAADFAVAVARLTAGEKAEAALDQRFAEAFTVSGNVEDCRTKAAAYAAAGVTELALTFSGSKPAADMRFMAEAMM
jgi:5,10-methylenetetrahydromethanopterin reductase